MNRLEIESKVKEVIALQFGMELDEIKVGTDFAADLSVDSLDSVEIIMGVEDRFDIMISDEEANNLMSVKSVIDYVEKKLADKER